MDLLSFLRTIAALGCVLGLLAGALFAVRRYNIALPGQTGGRSGRRLALVERVGIDGKRSVILIRRDDREHLIMVAPEGQTVIETNIVYQPTEVEPEAEAVAVAEAPAAKIQQDLAMLAALAGSAIGKAKAALARARAPKTAQPEAAADTPTAAQPDFAALVDRLGSAGAKAKAALSRSPRQRAATAAPAPAEAKAKPKRAPVRLKVTAPDGRTLVEPTPVAARAPVAQAA